MPLSSKVPTVEAARRWLEQPGRSSGAAFEALRSGLTNFVENRYGGAAEALKEVHALRLSLIEDPRPLNTLSSAGEGPWDGQTLGKAAAHSATPEQGRLLFHLTRAFTPDRVVELGTNIGISAAYIAIALQLNGHGKLTTIEASGIRLEIAAGLFDQLGLGGIETVQGYFDEALELVLSRLGTVEMAFVDGNHQRDATLRYFELLRQHMEHGGLVILDDIRWSDGMTEAWEIISSSKRAAMVVDLGRTGLVITT